MAAPSDVPSDVPLNAPSGVPLDVPTGVPLDLRERLQAARERGETPAIVARHRIDGPGSTLDMREFQQGLWRAPVWPHDPHSDPTAAWSAELPRTICLTIDTGTRVEARPYETGMIAVQSSEYGTEVVGRAGQVAAIRENWLIKAIDAFGLSGVAFHLESLRTGLLSAGLGGSATAMTGVCLLANRLAGDPMDGPQIVGLASRLEQDLGTSLTGTQEQSNVVWGGVVDYLWLPWGMPGEPRQGLGTSVRYELATPDRYESLAERIALFHTGKTRFSSTVNETWCGMLRDEESFPRLTELPAHAYEYREGLRLGDWARVLEGIRGFRQVRVDLVPPYMAGAEVLAESAADLGAEAFPLGAGGGGSVLVFAPDPAVLETLRANVAGTYEEIPFRLMPKGHEFRNC